MEQSATVCPADGAARSRRLKRNLWLVTGARAANMCIIGQGVINLFWEHTVGLQVQEMLYLQIINSVVLSILEVPSGYMSDTLGRKLTLCIAAAFKVLAFTIYGLATNFSLCCVAEISLAAGWACWSGTDKSILYESQAELGQQDLALHRESYAVFWAQGTEAAAAILGGLIATYVSLRAALLVTAVPYVVCLVLCAMMLEPNAKSLTKEQADEPEQSFFGGIRATFARKEITDGISVSIWLGGSTYLAVWLHQLLYERNGLPVPWFGVAWALLNVSVAVTSLASPYVYKRMGLYGAQAALGLWGVACWALMGFWQSPWAVIAGCLLNAQRGVNGPMFTTHLNHLLSAEVRATVMSCYSLIFRVLFCGIAFGAGYVAQRWGLAAACLAAGVVTGAATTLRAAWLLWRRPIRGTNIASESRFALKDWDEGREMPAVDAGSRPREEGPGANEAGHAVEGRRVSFASKGAGRRRSHNAGSVSLASEGDTQM